jgi:hypothetical protein
MPEQEWTTLDYFLFLGCAMIMGAGLFGFMYLLMSATFFTIGAW